MIIPPFKHLYSQGGRCTARTLSSSEPRRFAERVEDSPDRLDDTPGRLRQLAGGPAGLGPPSGAHGAARRQREGPEGTQVCAEGC